jgi:cytoskeletal protein RodZ
MADIGSTLREARMRDRIDISEVEAQTKIRAKYLRAIENEEWDLLPGTVYAKSFLRTYGDYLGLDSRMLLDEFKRRYERPSEHEVRAVGSIASRERERRERRDRRPTPRMPSWAPIAVVVILILVVLGVVGSLSSSTTSTTAHQRSHPRRPIVANKPATTTTVAAPTAATLQMVPTAPVYVCLVDGAGNKLINEQTFTPGQTIPTEKATKLLLTLGNASVQMKVNGKNVPVTPSPTAIRLLITPASVTHIPNSQTPTCP